MADSGEKLGSFADFEASVTSDDITPGMTVFGAYTERLGRNQAGLAKSLGITVEELHVLPNPSGSEALEGSDSLSKAA